jgi:4-alpha-glucanotransferase
MKFERASGIILHPTSLPGPYGIGDLGPQAHRWLDFLARTGSRLWQVLPLGPTGYGDSPYQSFSAFAGNPYLISPGSLMDEGLLQAEDLADAPSFLANRVDYGQVILWKLSLLDRSYLRFSELNDPDLRQAFFDFQQIQSSWLGDFALFMALKEAHGGSPWTDWEPDLRDRDPQVLAEARQTYPEAIQRQIYRQFIFFRQWSALRAQADELGIQIIGDIPIFVAHDSAEFGLTPSFSCSTMRIPWSGQRAAHYFTPASCGAIRSTAGTFTKPAATPGGSNASAHLTRRHCAHRPLRFAGYWSAARAKTAKRGAGPRPRAPFFRRPGSPGRAADHRWDLG